jgi:hypothetical protein
VPYSREIRRRVTILFVISAKYRPNEIFMSSFRRLGDKITDRSNVQKGISNYKNVITKAREDEMLRGKTLGR